MNKRKIPIRMCVACREPHEKRELLRIVKNNSGVVNFDLTGKAQGRGAYICPKIDCLDKAFKTKALNRALDCVITEEIYSDLKRVIQRREIGK